MQKIVNKRGRNYRCDKICFKFGAPVSKYGLETTFIASVRQEIRYFWCTVLVGKFDIWCTVLVCTVLIRKFDVFVALFLCAPYLLEI